MLHTLAQELNSILMQTVATKLFSECGMRMYFPKGIISQSAEAKKDAHKANGTIGMTLENGKAAILPTIKNYAPDFSSQELVAYAPTAGILELRNKWQEKIISKNPLLKEKKFSLPIVVPGLTAGLSYIADLFLDSTKSLILSNPSWDNYELIASARCNARVSQFNMFLNGKFDIASFEKVCIEESEKCASIRILLNFPHNPSGYTPLHSEVIEICNVIKKLADKGVNILAICDDAYFGLQYEDESEKQSLFAYLADIHPNVLAVKIDGPTKEDFAWGFRCGFVTFANKNFTDEHYDALQKKLMGIIRSSTSCSSTPSQSFLLRAFADKNLEEQKEYFHKMLQSRYETVRSIVDSKNSKVIEALPFNSGYFMSFNLNGIKAEVLRKTLLEKKGIGTIAINDQTLRVAFSSIDDENLKSVYTDIYETAEDLAKK